MTAVLPSILAMSTAVTAVLPVTRPLVSNVILTKLPLLACVTVANVVFIMTFCVPLKFCVGLLTSPLTLNCSVAVSMVAV